jgi:sterol desaturase/sphingolipid hydroxylase (fatty acid hydroxylase superfamily)
MGVARILDALVPAIVALAIVEWLVLRRRKDTYDWRESLASLGVATGHRFANAVTLVVLRPVFEALWAHRLFTLRADRPWTVLLLFLGVELAYYWQHRLSHRVRWLWASHAVHHTSERITVSAAYRLAWTDLVSGTPFFVAPVVFLGFSPTAVFAAVAVVVVYQGWIHTELVPALPVFDAVFNSPSNHRVHHARCGAEGGKNFGAVLVVFDRLFGTYAAEGTERPKDYGLDPPVRSYAPAALALHEWAAMARDLLKSRSLQEAVRACVGPAVRGRDVRDDGQSARSMLTHIVAQNAQRSR